MAPSARLAPPGYVQVRGVVSSALATVGFWFGCQPHQWWLTQSMKKESAHMDTSLVVPLAAFGFSIMTSSILLVVAIELHLAGRLLADVLIGAIIAVLLLLGPNAS